MARPYSQKFLMELFSKEDDAIGARLARACVRANLGTAHVAKAFDVSRATIHSWFRGSKILRKRHELIDVFISLVEKDMEAGDLPVTNAKQSKHYIETMLGRRL